MPRKLFHLFLKSTLEHEFYGSLSAIFLDKKNLGVSKFTLDRYDFEQPFNNDICEIRKGDLKTTGYIRAKNKSIK